jgi:hypothetical protein
MHAPPPLRIDLAPSRTSAVLIGLSCVATAALVAWLPLPWELRVATILAIGINGGRALATALQWPQRATVGFVLRADRTLTLLLRDGRTAFGCVQPASYVGACLTTVVWREPGRRIPRALLILPDMLDGEAFRQLRVLLRYGRSDEVAGVPASQARASTIVALSPLRWPQRR